MQYGNMALRALWLRGGKASQAELEGDVGIPPDRLGPVLAGLHHNGYIVRGFMPGMIEVTLTEEGRQWATKRGLVAASGEASPPPPPLPQRTVEPPRRAPLVAPRAAAAPLQVRLAEGDGRRRTLTMRAPAPAAGDASAIAPEPAPPVAPPTAAPPEPQAAPPAASAPDTHPGIEIERRRPRRRKTAVETEAQDEVIATDDSGFVTHIKGKAIF